MNGYIQQEPKPIRLVFELARADNPRLFDELTRFAQGPKRVNRLRVLAYDGLLAQFGVLTMGAAAAPMEPSGRRDAVSDHAAITNSVFAPGVAQ